MKAIERLLLATDFSAGAAAAAEAAVQLARQTGAAIDVVNVVDTSPLAEAYGDASYRLQHIEEIRTQAHEQALKFVDRHLGDCENVRVFVRDGNTFLEILDAARELGSDWIVMGTHGRTGLPRVVIGSIAEKVVRASTIPVVTVRGPA